MPSDTWAASHSIIVTFTPIEDTRLQSDTAVGPCGGVAGNVTAWSCGACGTTSTAAAGHRARPAGHRPGLDAASTSGAGGGDVSVALAEIVGRDGRVYAVDSDPTARDEVAEAAAAHSQVLAITQAGEDLRLPEPVDLAFCRFLLLHVVDPAVVLARMAGAVRPGGWVVAQEPITSAPAASTASRSPCPPPATPTSAPSSRRSPATPAWSPSTRGPRRPPGPGRDRWPTTSSWLTEVDPGDDPVVLPPLVTVVAQASHRPAARGSVTCDR